MYTKTLIVFIVSFLFFLIFLFFSYQHEINDKKNTFKISEKNRSFKPINSGSESIPILNDFKNFNPHLMDGNFARRNTENYFIQSGAKYYISESSNKSLKIIVISTAIVASLKNDSKTGEFDSANVNAPLYISTSVLNPLPADAYNTENRLIIKTEVIASMDNNLCDLQNFKSSNCSNY